MATPEAFFWQSLKTFKMAAPEGSRVKVYIAQPPTEFFIKNKIFDNKLISYIKGFNLS